MKTRETPDARVIRCGKNFCMDSAGPRQNRVDVSGKPTLTTRHPGLVRLLAPVAGEPAYASVQPQIDPSSIGAHREIDRCRAFG